MKKDNEGIETDYAEFLGATQVVPPRALTTRVLSQIHQALNPNAWAVFSKIALLHFISALATLSICPQFGVRTFGEGMGLMHAFMSFGSHGCMIACGGLFTGTSLALGGLLLRPEEVRVLRSHRLLQISALTLLSLGAFLMLDVEIAVGFALSWLVGAILAGAATLELSWGLRLKWVIHAST